jgi:hypothetical protein
MGKVKETLLNEIYEKYELYDYDVIVKINEKIWKKKYDDVMEELTAPKRTFVASAAMGDETELWKENKGIIHYGIGGIFVEEPKEQMITREKKRKHPWGHLYSVRWGQGKNVWITADEVELYRQVKNQWSRDTHDESLWKEVWEGKTPSTFLNSCYLQRFAKIFRIPKHLRPDKDYWYRTEEWEDVWRFHRLKSIPKGLKNLNLIRHE